MMKFIGIRIGDPNIKRMIVRLLKAGIMEKGKIEATDKGTAQGSVVSPIQANIYLHYVLDLWFEKVVKKRSKGQVFIVRYADDFICGFQYKEEADEFYKALKKKTRQIQA